MSHLSTAELDKVVKLAGLQMDPEQKLDMFISFNRILDLVSQLEAVRVEEIPDTFNPITNQTQPLREDTAPLPMNRKKLQSVAPHVKDGLYLVPLVIKQD